MAVEVRSFQVTTPTFTDRFSPLTTDLTMPVRIVTAIDILVPPGPSGHLGIAVSASGVPIIPINPGEWLVADDEKLHWDLEDQIESGAWQLQSWNDGEYSHTVWVRFSLQPYRVGSGNASVISPTISGLTSALPLG
jgi:hypothetical protein